jgi:3-phosphoshikimate 1-carboxyvinyltransferase
MILTVHPGKAIRGEVDLPGDKSLSHRAVLFAALAQGESRIENFLVSGVTRVMLDSLAAMGVTWQLEGDVLRVQGRGLQGLHAPSQALNCGNSATTIRLLAGLVAAAGIEAVLDGSEGLRKRPMDRIVEPLARMGVRIEASEGRAPLHILARPQGQRLQALHETLPVASAQVKSCLLLASLAGDGPYRLEEPGPSRDHTERMLGSMGVRVQNLGEQPGGSYVTVLEPAGAEPLHPLHMRLPGDISSAAFLMVAGLIAPGSEIRVRGVGLNPTRTGLVDALQAMGGDIRVENLSDQGGEPSGDLLIRASRLHATAISGPLVVRMIDEFSAFGAAAAYAEGVCEVRDARELRYKESDRITTLCQELGALGVRCEEYEDGFRVWGGQPGGGAVAAHGDHRLAMAMTIAGLAASAPVQVAQAEMMNESFPGFAETLLRLGADLSQSEAVQA